MQFDFEVFQLLPQISDDFILITSEKLQELIHKSKNDKSIFLKCNGIAKIIDEIGTSSSKSQKLNSIITTFAKFVSVRQNILVKIHKNEIIGFIKTGIKSLCYHDQKGKYTTIKPVCVLDFFVNENCQRLGFGKEIFDKVLEVQQLFPWQLAIDKPSNKFLNFLKKHYNLCKYFPQNNNFVIFDKFFEIKIEKKEEFENKENLNQTNIVF